MKWTGGGGIRGSFLFAGLMLVAVVMTCLIITWVMITRGGPWTIATNASPGKSAASSDRQPRVSDDRPALDFTLTSLEGSPVSLSQFSGQPVVINYWATWCPPCRTEMPHLIEAYEQEEGRIVFLAISVDEPAATVRRFAQEHRIPFTILLDEGGKVASDYGVNGIPVTFFIGRDGEIVVRYVGQMSPRAIEEGLRRIR